VQAVEGPDLRLLLLGVAGLRVLELGGDRVARDRGEDQEDQHVGEQHHEQGLAGAPQREGAVAASGPGGRVPAGGCGGGGGEGGGAHACSFHAAWYEGIATALKVMPCSCGDCT